MSYNTPYFIGIGSARAAVVARSGEIKVSSTKYTITWRDQHDYRIFKQSTNNIWKQICTVVEDVLKQSGLGFDFTCSLAVSDFDGNLITMTKGSCIGNHGDRNVIQWAGHCAEKEAESTPLGRSS